MKPLPSVLASLLVMTVSVYAAVSDYYIYPAGPVPDGVPPITPGVTTNIELAGWADAAVDGNAPSMAFGADEAMHTEYSYAGRQDADLLVDFSDAYPLIGDGILIARLYLYVFGGADASPTIGLEAARILSTWSEGTVTWDSRPAVDSSTEPAYSGTPGLNKRIGINITEPAQAEQAEMSPADRHGIGLFDTTAMSPYFFAKESPKTEYRPYVHVVVPEPGALLLLAASVWVLRWRW
jgi:hypothetical protein